MQESENQETWLKFECVRPYLVEYIAFLMNACNGDYDGWDVTRLDKKRKKLHDRVCEAFSRGRTPSWMDRENIKVSDLGALSDRNDGNIEKMAYDAWINICRNISANTSKYWEIRPMFASNESVAKSIERKRKDYEKFLADCEEIHEAWKRDRDIFNSHFEKYDDQCWKSFSHDYNGAKSSIKSDFSLLDNWKLVPISAMLEPSVEEYYYAPLKRIQGNKEKMAYCTFLCMTFHRDFLAGKTKWDVSGIDFGKGKKDE